jgi:large subunit ribosomal protein L25
LEDAVKQKGNDMSIKLNAEIRKVAGKGAARASRRNDRVPGVIYGTKKSPVAIDLDRHTWVEMIKKPGLRTKLFEIAVGGDTESAMLIDIQYHPVTDAPQHVDFKRIDVKKPVTVSIPIEIKNLETSRGIKMGGTLNFAVRSVLINALVDAIPESIVVDMLDLNIGDVVHGSDLKLPAGVELGLRQAELAFVAITGKMKEEAEAPKPTAAPAKDAKAAPAKKK